MYDKNYLAHQLSRHVAAAPDRVFARRQGKPDVSYSQLFELAEQMATTLRRAGLKPGERVAVQVEKSLESVALYLGTVLAGGIFLPLNTAYTASEVSYFLNDATPRIVVCDPERESEFSALTGQAKLLTLGGEQTGSLITDLAETVSNFVEQPCAADDLAAILYTSGTTGRSKGAMLSHKNLASNSDVLREYWQFTERDTLIHALPIFHTHGLFVATNVALLSGAGTVFLSKFDADAILEAMPDATALMGVPTFYTRLLADPRLDKKRTANMRLFISGSAPLLVDTHEQWQERTGHRILERYGMTETNMSTSNPYTGERRAGTVGFPLPGVDLRIRQEEKNLPQGEIGVIEVRGDNVFQGYWQMPEKTAEELRPDGWFITGDLGVVDADGYVTIVGRAKDLIITGGFNVYPKEIEALIDDIPGVLESAVIGVPHPDFGEAVVTVIVPQEPDLKVEEIEKVTKQQLARFKQPKQILFLPELPRNTMGKVQKKTLRETYSKIFEQG